MAVAVVVTLGLALFLIAYGMFRGTCWHRTPRELRGDWWGRFERQFRAYVSAHPQHTERQPPSF